MQTLTQKEKLLLEDLKKDEEICIRKYSDYANMAQDQQLKQILQSNGQQEEQHLNTINQLFNAQIPPTTQQSPTPMQHPGISAGANNPNDSYLCNDLLSTEKYVSGSYDTAIFEFTNPNMRQVLNHIQKEEQEHGQKIAEHMISNGMYQPQ